MVILIGSLVVIVFFFSIRYVNSGMNLKRQGLWENSMRAIPFIGIFETLGAILMVKQKSRFDLSLKWLFLILISLIIKDFLL